MHILDRIRKLELEAHTHVQWYVTKFGDWNRERQPTQQEREECFKMERRSLRCVYARRQFMSRRPALP